MQLRRRGARVLELRPRLAPASVVLRLSFLCGHRAIEEERVVVRCAVARIRDDGIRTARRCDETGSGDWISPGAESNAAARDGAGSLLSHVSRCGLPYTLIVVSTPRER